jgi:hypothetical protein
LSLSGGLEQSGEIFDFSDDPFLLWTSAKLNKLIARFLEKSGDLCLKLACANISVSAKVEIVGVPRSIKVYPSTRQVSEGEKFELTVEILDQYQSDYLTVELSDIGLYEWQKLGQLEAIGGKFNENGILILNDSSSEVKEVEVILKGSLEISEGYTIEDSTRIKVKKLLEVISNTLKVNETLARKKSEIFEPEPALVSEPALVFESASELDTHSISIDYKSWFYRSQLFYDGYLEEDITEYSDYLEYQDFRSYMERSE